MRFTAAFAILAATLATPALAQSAIVNTFSGDTCTGDAQAFTLAGSGSFRCVPFSNRRSISVAGGGCQTVTWSGGNCQGSSFVVPDSGCHSVLFAAVSVQC